MKRIFGALLFLILLSGCALFDDYSWVGVEEVTTIEEALNFMIGNITYELDTEDFWQFPEETFNLKTGDCEDMAALLAHLFIYNVGLGDVYLVGCIRKSDRKPHVMVRIGNVYYEPTHAREYPYYEVYYTIRELSYQNYIDIARLYHL